MSFSILGTILATTIASGVVILGVLSQTKTREPASDWGLEDFLVLIRMSLYFGIPLGAIVLAFLAAGN
jgi:hypothetical protein